jgi:hypothetical protein
MMRKPPEVTEDVWDSLTSPENYYCDGELTREQADRRFHTAINKIVMDSLREKYREYSKTFKDNRLDLTPFASRLQGETDTKRVREGVSAMRSFLIYRGFMENDPHVSRIDGDNRPEFDLSHREDVEGYLERTPVRAAVSPVVHKLGVPNPVPGKFYMVGDTPFEVRMSKRGFLYARKRHNGVGKWEYAKGVIFAIRENGREATVDDISKLSLQHKRCFVCGRALEAEKSVKRGIGPVCSKTVQFGRKDDGKD